MRNEMLESLDQAASDAQIKLANLTVEKHNLKKAAADE